MPEHNATSTTYPVSFHHHGRYQLELNSRAPMSKVIFVATVTADTPEDALRGGIKRGQERGFISQANAERLLSNIVPGNASVALS